MAQPIAAPDRWASAPRRPRAAAAGQSRATQRGQSLVEYILILSLIAIVALVALTFFGGQLNDLFSVIGSQINP